MNKTAAVLVFDPHGNQELDICDLPDLPVLVVIGANIKEVTELIDSKGIERYKHVAIKRLLEEWGYEVIRVPKGNTDLYSAL